MIEQGKRLIAFVGPNINLRECSGDLWPVKGVLRFWSQLDGVLAFRDRRIFLTESGKNLAKDCMASGILRTFAHESLGNYTCALECSMRVHFVALIMIKQTFEKAFRQDRMNRNVKCYPRKFLDP